MGQGQDLDTQSELVIDASLNRAMYWRRELLSQTRHKALVFRF